MAPTPQPVKKFLEKPDLATAEKLLKSDTHAWNAGIFLFTTTAILEAFELLAPQILSLCRKAVNLAQVDLSFLRLATEPWDRLEEISIDHAILERASNISAVLFNGQWSDLGDWKAIWREYTPDDHGVVTSDHATALDCSNALLMSASKNQELVGIGLENIIAISMSDAVLIMDKDRAQEAKIAVRELKNKNVHQAETLPVDYRPWGWFESVDKGSKYQVKKIVVNPGAALSLQSHKHRAEHWIVVEGTAKVQINDKVKIVKENQSIYIPLGAMHRMENPGKVPLTLIEVQTGSYFGEDDIVRYEDVYSRGQGIKG